MLWVLLGGVLGFFAGLAGGIASDLHLADSVEAWLTGVLQAAAPWENPCYLRRSAGYLLGFYLSAKRLYMAWDGEDETLPDQVDRKLIIRCSALPWQPFWTSSLSRVGVLYTDSGRMALLIVGEMLVSVALVVLVQQKIVDLVRRMNPEKQVSVYDSKFQKKWYDTCDEAERSQIGQAPYQAFQAANQAACIALWLVLLLLSYVLPIGLLPMAAVLLIWAVLQVSYILACIRLGARGA